MCHCSPGCVLSNSLESTEKRCLGKSVKKSRGPKISLSCVERALPVAMSLEESGAISQCKIPTLVQNTKCICLFYFLAEAVVVTIPS